DRIGLPSSAAAFAGGSGTELAQAVAAARQPALGIWRAGRDPEVRSFEGESMLGVELLHDKVLPALGYSPDAATDGTLVYRSNPDELWQQVASGELKTGIWLPPMLPAEFSAAIADGQMLPPKSTRFMPKVMSGLVWADHDSRIL
ncbi:MAG: hypothetical protein ACLGI9_07630, partial [Thermoanaerobaculia bacterium]